MTAPEFRTVVLEPAEAALRDARQAWDEALRSGDPGQITRARRFLREARQAAR